jgi:hypothetical protein
MAGWVARLVGSDPGEEGWVVEQAVPGSPAAQGGPVRGRSLHGDAAGADDQGGRVGVLVAGGVAGEEVGHPKPDAAEAEDAAMVGPQVEVARHALVPSEGPGIGQDPLPRSIAVLQRTFADLHSFAHEVLRAQPGQRQQLAVPDRDVEVDLIPPDRAVRTQAALVANAAQSAARPEGLEPGRQQQQQPHQD